MIGAKGDGQEFQRGGKYEQSGELRTKGGAGPRLEKGRGKQKDWTEWNRNHGGMGWVKTGKGAVSVAGMLVISWFPFWPHSPFLCLVGILSTDLSRPIAALEA